jgi:hypothetical protein
MFNSVYKAISHLTADVNECDVRLLSRNVDHHKCYVNGEIDVNTK